MEGGCEICGELSINGLPEEREPMTPVVEGIVAPVIWQGAGLHQPEVPRVPDYNLSALAKVTDGGQGQTGFLVQLPLSGLCGRLRWGDAAFDQL